MIDFVGSIWIRMNTRVEWSGDQEIKVRRSIVPTLQPEPPLIASQLAWVSFYYYYYCGEERGRIATNGGIDFLCPLYSSRSDWLTVTDWRSIIGSLNIIRSRVGFLFGLINNNNKIVYRNGKVIRSGIQSSIGDWIIYRWMCNVFGAVIHLQQWKERIKALWTNNYALIPRQTSRWLLRQINILLY